MSSEVMLGKNEIGDLFSIVLPKVKNAIKIDETLRKVCRKIYTRKTKSKSIFRF